MTTATLQFDQPTLFREGRFTREGAVPSAGDAAPRAGDAGPRVGDAAPRARDAAPPGSPPPADVHASRGRLTLDDLLSATWDGLAAHHSVTCPVCSGSMVPRYGSGATPVGGRCKRCGSTLG
jgi:hypothetical protein